MLVLLLFAGFLLFAPSSPTDYSYNGCDKPKKLLCRDVFIAHECGVLGMCVKQWNSHSWRPWATDLSATCIYCQYVSDTNRSSVVNWASKRLQKTVDTYEYNQFASMIQFENHKDGKEIMCNVLSACKSHTYIGDMDFGGIVCDSCKEVIDDLRNLFTANATTETIINVLDNVICRKVPEGFRTFCLDNVKVHVPTILIFFKNHTNSDDICRFVDLCGGPTSEGLSKILNTSIALEKDCTKPAESFSWINRPSTLHSTKWTSYDRFNLQQPDCGECNAVLKVIQQRLADKTIQQHLISELKQRVCRFVVLLENVCEEEIDSQSGKIFDTIMHSDTNEVCRYFGMCLTDSSSGSLLRQQITNYLAPQLPLTEGVPLPGVCELCELVISKVVGLVLDEVTPERITAALDQVCKLIPTQFEQKCDQLVQQYGPAIVEAIIKGTTPGIACASLGLCQSPVQRDSEIATVGSATHSMRLIRYIIPLLLSDTFSSPGQSSIECELCKSVQSAVSSALSDKKIVSLIKSEMEAFCKYLPSSTEECIEFIDKNFDLILDYLKPFVAGSEFCKIIGACRSADPCSTNADYPCSSLKAAIQCSSIQRCIALGKASNLLVVNQSLCDQLSLADTCVSLELAHACGKQEECDLQSIANLVENVVASPPVASTRLLPRPNTVRVSSGTPPSPTDACGICSNLVKEVSLRWKLYGLAVMDNARCLFFRSAEERDQCKKLVGKINQVIPDIVSGQLTGLKICQKHALCQELATNIGTDRRTSSFGSSCADGPLYWCSSRRTAAICNAENYCKAFGYSSSVTDSPKSATTNGYQAGAKQDVFGLNPCEYGLTFWCQSKANAQQCGPEAVRHCETRVWQTSTPCSWGPTFWCASSSNAELCDKVLYCKTLNKRLQKRTS